MTSTPSIAPTVGSLKAPFPWFGGKSRVAHLVWPRFGDVNNYVEPFAGSLAVLLNRPHAPKVETINDIDCYLANFWRAVKYVPDEVARHADWPVNEADLHARHQWLISHGARQIETIKADPHFYDAKVAAWWVWGLSQWIGSGWCEQLHKKRPHLMTPGKGTHRQLPRLSGFGSGVHCQSRIDIEGYLGTLSARLRRVRVCCGDWTRIMGPSVTTKLGVTGVFFDPPYDGYEDLYANKESVSSAVWRWATENGDNPKLRIALCGYEGEHEMPDSWECVAWKTRGGYGSQRKKGSNDNAARERIWFSPHCQRQQMSLAL